MKRLVIQELNRVVGGNQLDGALNPTTGLPFGQDACGNRVPVASQGRPPSEWFRSPAQRFEYQYQAAHGSLLHGVLEKLGHAEPSHPPQIMPGSRGARR
jgi:hypothetical protein